MWDNLMAQDPKIQQMRAESRNEGIQEGIVAMQGAVLDTLKERFPHLAETATADIEHITSLDALRPLIAEIAVARDETMARRAIDAYLPH